MTTQLKTDAVPQSCNTPLGAIDALRQWLRRNPNEPAEVSREQLTWLLNDAETLNKLITDVHYR